MKLLTVTTITILAVAWASAVNAVARPENEGATPMDAARFQLELNRDTPGQPNIQEFSGSAGGLLANIRPDCIATGKCTLCEMLQVGVNIGNFILSIIGAVALLIFLWGAFGLVMARGEEEKIKEAKGSIWNALAGVVFALIAWQLIALILFILTGKANPFEGVC